MAQALYYVKWGKTTLVRKRRYLKRGRPKKIGGRCKRQMDTGYFLLRERRASGLSRLEAANLSGVPYTTLTALELNRMRAGRSVRYRLMRLYIRIKEERLQDNSMQHRLQATANS